jgi:hypothetical protein
MVGLITQKRDLVHKTLSTNSAAATADIAQDIYLTSRQIGHGLKPILPHLAQRNVAPKTTPGPSIAILCCSAGRSCLLHKLDSQPDVQIVFSPGQRAISSPLLVDCRHLPYPKLVTTYCRCFQANRAKRIGPHCELGAHPQSKPNPGLGAKGLEIMK